MTTNLKVLQKTNLTKRLWLYLLLINTIIAVPACRFNDNSSEQKTKETDLKEKELSQSSEELMKGHSRAICYSGFRSGQHPDRGEGAVNPSYAEIVEDLQILSNHGFRLIRIYDCGENSRMVLRAIDENDFDINVLLGIWLRAELSNHETCEWLTEPIPEAELQENKKMNLAEIKQGIELANQYPDIISAVNVGNEALVDWNDHKVDTDTIITYVNRVKAAIPQPVTVADNYKWWADHGKELAAAVDFVSIHIYPVWEGKDIDEGLSYSIENINEVQQTLPGSIIVITEAGWPSIASEFGERASQQKQRQYYREFISWTEKKNMTCFWFEAFDEDWKGNPEDPLGAEKHWGIFTVDRKPKLVVEEFLKNES